MAHIRQGDASVRRTAASPMMWGCQGLSLCCCRDKIVKSGPRFSFVCWRGFFLFFFSWARLAWLDCPFFFFFFYFFDLRDMIAKFYFLQKIL